MIDDIYVIEQQVKSLFGNHPHREQNNIVYSKNGLFKTLNSKCNFSTGFLKTAYSIRTTCEILVRLKENIIQHPVI